MGSAKASLTLASGVDRHQLFVIFGAKMAFRLRIRHYAIDSLAQQMSLSLELQQHPTWYL